jgi:hypothetical protein
MNDFASVLTAALQKDAKETEMSVDMQKAETQLKESIAAAKRRRTVWAGVLAAAAVIIIVAGAAFAFLRPTTKAGPVAPSPSTSPSAQVLFPFTAQMTPPLTAQLPAWVARAEVFSNGAGGATFAQTNCDAPSGLCADGQDRRIDVLPIRHMYALDSDTSISPTYAQFVAAWSDVQRLGYGNVTDVTTTTVDGQRATTMRVALTKPVNGLAGCESATAKKNEGGCFGLVPGVTLDLAIIYRGAGQPPTLLWESHNSTNKAETEAIATEFLSWLATVQLD